MWHPRAEAERAPCCRACRWRSCNASLSFAMTCPFGAIQRKVPCKSMCLWLACGVLANVCVVVVVESVARWPCGQKLDASLDVTDRSACLRDARRGLPRVLSTRMVRTSYRRYASPPVIPLIDRSGSRRVWRRFREGTGRLRHDDKQHAGRGAAGAARAGSRPGGRIGSDRRQSKLERCVGESRM